MSHAQQFIAEAARILNQLDPAVLEQLAGLLLEVRRRGGRLFFLGSAAARPIARTPSRFSQDCPDRSLRSHRQRLRAHGPHQRRRLGDRLRQLAAGQQALRQGHDLHPVGRGWGSGEEHQPQPGAPRQYAKEIGATVGGICGRNGGYTAQVADVCVVVPTVNAATVTPHAEAFQAVIWHLLVSHPALKAMETKWESATKTKAA